MRAAACPGRLSGAGADRLPRCVLPPEQGTAQRCADSAVLNERRVGWASARSSGGLSAMHAAAGPAPPRRSSSQRSAVQTAQC